MPPETNPLLLAAEPSPSPALLELLRSNPSLASKQDEYGYSLLHALASYNHIDLLVEVAQTYNLDPNTITDEDGETALFVVETVEAAQTLVEKLGCDWKIKNDEGKTAEERIREEGDFVVIADYLGELRRSAGGDATAGDGGGASEASVPPLPEGMTLKVGTMDESELNGEVDEGFRRRIEELSQRPDFGEESGQQELRALVQEAVRGVAEDERDVRRRLE